MFFLSFFMFKSHKNQDSTISQSNHMPSSSRNLSKEREPTPSQNWTPSSSMRRPHPSPYLNPSSNRNAHIYNTTQEEESENNFTNSKAIKWAPRVSLFFYPSSNSINAHIYKTNRKAHLQITKQLRRRGSEFARRATWTTSYDLVWLC